MRRPAILGAVSFVALPIAALALGAASASALVPLAVANDDSGPGFITDEDSAFVTADVLANDAGEPSTLSVFEVDDSGTIGIVTPPAAPNVGTFGYDPNGQFETLGVGASATDSFIYRAADDAGESDRARVTITINGVNDLPVAADDNIATDEHSAVAGNVLAANGGPADSDVDVGDVLGVSQVEGSAGNVGTTITLASGALLTVQSDGSFVYDPNGQFENVSGGDSVVDDWTYQLSDPNGGVDTAVVLVRVHGIDDPVVAVPDSGPGFQATEDTQFTTGNVLANDFDLDDCTTGLFVASFDSTTAAGGSVAPGPVDGTFVYVPPADFNGSDSFTYTADSVGSCAGAPAASTGGLAAAVSAPATVTLDVAPVNDAPVATDDGGAGFATVEDVPFTTGSVLDNDFDVDLDVLSVAASDPVSSEGGVVVSNGDGTFDYTPPPGFSGVDTFRYTVTDGLALDDAVVTIAVAEGAGPYPGPGPRPRPRAHPSPRPPAPVPTRSPAPVPVPVLVPAPAPIPIPGLVPARLLVLVPLRLLVLVPARLLVLARLRLLVPLRPRPPLPPLVLARRPPRPSRWCRRRHRPTTNPRSRAMTRAPPTRATQS